MTEKVDLILFTKVPELGRVKSRLASEIGEEKALTVFEQLLSNNLDILRSVKGHHTISFEGNSDNLFLKNLEDFDLLQQEGSDLGERMLNAFIASHNSGFQKTLLLGSDISDLERSDLELGIELLEKKDLVIGPAYDGGYYLIGMKKPHDVFSGILWGNETTFEQSISKISLLGLDFGFLPKRHDLDTLVDLENSGIEVPDLSKG